MQSDKNINRRNFSLNFLAEKQLQELSDRLNLNYSQTITLCLSMVYNDLLKSETLGAPKELE